MKLIARSSYEEAAARTSSPFDYPLSARLDENDAILVFDRALIPWENVLVYDPDLVSRFHMESGWLQRGIFQSAIRMGVKLDFLAGLTNMALKVTGANSFRGVQASLGEIIPTRQMVSGLIAGMVGDAQPGPGGSLTPNPEYARSYAAWSPTMYRRVRELIENMVASGLIYLNSDAVDFQEPQLRQYLDVYLRGSNGLTALDRSKTMKLLWDALGSQFGARHELYEANYFGQPDSHFLAHLRVAEQFGRMRAMEELTENCMSDYDLQGWTAPDLIQPWDVSGLPRTAVATSNV